MQKGPPSAWCFVESESLIFYYLKAVGVLSFSINHVDDLLMQFLTKCITYEYIWERKQKQNNNNK